MLTTIKEFIVGIGDALLSLLSFVIGFFEDIAYLVELTANFVLSIPQFFAWLPAELVAMIVLIFSVVVIYKVLGREG